ncbi:MAG: hypothetical protein OEU51_06000 [Gammaproteobacteria bacterium]|jgi:hypothetical protein|nr:hypothetical protein [Gammaproteobacteria bacterium]
MEEQEYRATYKSINQRRCIFEKAVNSRRCTCEQSARFCLADREGVACNSEDGNRRCIELLDTMRRNARFSLQLTHADGPLPHNKEIRVQTGGLLGLQQLLCPEQTDSGTVVNIYGLVKQAVSTFGQLDALPYDRIIQSIVSFQGRKKRGKRSR